MRELTMRAEGKLQEVEFDDNMCKGIGNVRCLGLLRIHGGEDLKGVIIGEFEFEDGVGKAVIYCPYFGSEVCALVRPKRMEKEVGF
jgi:hypothetical protein